MKKFLLSLFIIFVTASDSYCQNGLINPEQIAKSELNTYTAGESFQDQELAYLDTSSNTLKKLITGVYKSYEVNIIPSGGPQIRATPCGTNEVLVVALAYSSPNQTLYLYYINNNNPENPIIINSGTLLFATGTAQTYYETIYVGDSTAYFFYMKSNNSVYCRAITNIKTTGGATLGDELLLFSTVSVGYAGAAYYDPINDKILIAAVNVSGKYCVISSPKSSPVVSIFAPSYGSFHTCGNIINIGSNKALYFYSDNSTIFAECIINIDTTPQTTSQRTSKALYSNLTEVYYKNTYAVYLGNNKGAVFVTENTTPYKAWGVPFSIIDDSVVFGDAVLISDSTEGITMQWIAAVAIGSNVAVTITTNSSGRLIITYVSYMNNKLYTSSCGINIYDLSVVSQGQLIYMGNNSLVAIERGYSDMIVLNNIMPYYNTDPTNIKKYIVLGSYKTNEVALCKILPKKSYSDNYSYYSMDTSKSSLFIGPTNSYSPYRILIPSSANINNIGNTYYPIMPPDASAFGNNYTLDTIGTILQKNLKNIKGF